MQMPPICTYLMPPIRINLMPPICIYQMRIYLTPPICTYLTAPISTYLTPPICTYPMPPISTCIAAIARHSIPQSLLTLQCRGTTFKLGAILPIKALSCPSRRYPAHQALTRRHLAHRGAISSDGDISFSSDNLPVYHPHPSLHYPRRPLVRLALHPHFTPIAAASPSHLLRYSQVTFSADPRVTTPLLRRLTFPRRHRGTLAQQGVGPVLGGAGGPKWVYGPGGAGGPKWVYGPGGAGGPKWVYGPGGAGGPAIGPGEASCAGGLPGPVGQTRPG
jgi:hypothetical protein